MPRVSKAHLEKRREQILGAAARCFARQGFHRTTMQDIVREAALSPGAIYRYFAAKEDIIAAIATRRRASERALLEEAAGGADVREGLRQLARTFLGRLSDPREQRWRRVTVQLWGEALRNPAVMDVVRDGLDGPLVALARLVRRGQREGRVPKGLDPEAAARVAAALFQGLVLQQAWDPKVDVDGYVRAAQALLDAWLLPKPTRP
jgi:TetR/AcrR family transcriptional regulator, transcriptional repressor of aconitase